MRRVLGKLQQYWTKRGTLATVQAISRELLSLLIRHRCRLVFEASLTVPREPSNWGPREKLLILCADNVRDLHPELLATMEPEKHRDDLQSVSDGNALFVVAYENCCLHRAYVCTVDRPALAPDRKAVFFGHLEKVPMIRGSETTSYLRDKQIYRHVQKGLYTRVLNEQLRYLQAHGYRAAALFIMAENTMSIKGATAAGFQLARVLNDWVFFRSVIVQKVCEQGVRRWRVFLA